MNVTKLEGRKLDAAVANAMSAESSLHILFKDGEPFYWHHEEHWAPYEPSRLWAHGGPHIDIAHIGTSFEEVTGQWHAELEHSARADGVQRTFASGPTALIAAMRAFVASRQPTP